MKTYGTLLAAAILLASFFGCSPYGNELQYVKLGQVNIQVTDAPFPTDWISEAHITITKIDARIASSEDEEDSGFQTLFEGNETLNLLELRNGITADLGSVEIPAGSYDLVRLYVTESSITLKDGTTYEVKVPSGEQTGIKVFIKPALEVISELSTDLLLDVDVSKSFVLRGNPEKMEDIKGFIFKPVVRAVNMTETGTLKGQVTEIIDENPADIEGAEIQVIAADTVYTTTFTNENGLYTLLGIPEGSFRVEAAKEGYLPSTAEEVLIFKGNSTTEDFLLEAEQ